MFKALIMGNAPAKVAPAKGNSTGRSANPGIVARAVAKVKRNDDRNWVPGGMPTHQVDRIYGMQLLELKEGRMEAETETSGPKEAVEVIQAQLDSFFTAVLATVHAGAWRLNWVAGLLFVLLSSVPCCYDLKLLAIKGGAACDCEIKFIEALMEELGAEVEAFREVFDDGERICLLYTSPSPRDRTRSRMPSSA